MGWAIDTRAIMYRAGVDFGADARVLAVSGWHRLVWARGHSQLMGMRGLGSRTFACSLSLRTFRQAADGRVEYAGSQELFAEGRLLAARISTVSAEIDLCLGTGTAAAIAARLSQRKTLYLTEDFLAHAFAEQDRREAERRKTALPYNPLRVVLHKKSSFDERLD